MQTIRTIRCKICIPEDDLPIVRELFSRYAAACTRIAGHGRKERESNAIRLHHALYRKIRTDFGLPANLVVTALRRVGGNLKASNFKGKFEYKPTSVYLDSRTFTLKLSKGVISFSTHVGRRVIATLNICSYQHEAIWGAGTAQAAMVVKARDGYWMNIFVESEVEESRSAGVLGVDLGIRNIAATSGGYKRTGKDLREYRERRWRVRASLQSKGTKGAKRALRRLSGRERRRAAWVNHNVAKEIVEDAVKNGCSLIRMEDLKGIRERTRVPNRHRNRMTALWAFGQLQAFVKYKAAMKGVSIELVDPAYTSKTCHKCKKEGLRDRETFVCTPCGLAMDADVNAALVIAAGGAVVSRPGSDGQVATQVVAS